MLNQFEDGRFLKHEERGVLYTTYGALYVCMLNEDEAKKYYQLAAKEFLITNSPHINAVKQMLARLSSEQDEL